MALTSPHPASRRRKRSGLRRSLVAVALAFVGHVFFVALILLLSHLQLQLPPGRPIPAPERPVVMRPLSTDQWLKNRGAQNDQTQQKQTRDEKKIAEAEKKKPEVIPDGQVVDVAPGNNEQDPNAKYLAESDNKVKKETRAKEQSPFYRNAMPKKTTSTPQQSAGNDNVEKEQIAGNDGLGADDRPLKDESQRRRVFEVPDVKARQEIAMKTDPTSQGPGIDVSNQAESDEVQGNSDRLKMLQGSEGGDEESSQGKRGKAGVANLMPSEAVLDKITGAAPNDRLTDVDEGEGTFLNTKEWKYASFFNRVKQSIGQHWDPNQSIRQRDPSGQIYGGRDRYTVVSVTLNESGRLKDIYVEKSCGLDFLDLEAIRSFERAQPFPNPPPGLVTGDSTVKFSFGFFLDMSGGPKMRLFRQAN